MKTASASPCSPAGISAPRAHVGTISTPHRTLRLRCWRRLTASQLAAAILLACWTGTALHAAADCGDAVEVHVVFTPGTVVVDDSKPSRELQKTARSAALYQLGVTRATPQRIVRVRMYESEHCARPLVSLQLSVRPLVIELASELGGSGCLRAYVLEHEMQHVAIYNATTRRAALQIEREMQAQLSVTHRRGNGGTLRELQTQVNEHWLPRLDALVAQGDADQQVLDADQERLAYRACSSEIAQFIRTFQ